MVGGAFSDHYLPFGNLAMGDERGEKIKRFLEIVLNNRMESLLLRLRFALFCFRTSH